MQQTVFLVEDDADVRTAVARLLVTSGFTVRSYASAEEFLHHEPDDRPGCVVSDLRLPGRDGLDLFATLHASGRVTPIIFMTAFADVPSSVLAMKNGAVDFLIKPVTESVLLQAVRQGLALDLDLRSRRARQEEVGRRYDLLTRREAQVFWLVVDGKLNKQIAKELHISQQTVKVHRRRVMQKMQAGSIAALVHQAQPLEQERTALAAGPPAHKRAG